MMEIKKYIDHTLLKPTATKTQINRLCNEAIEYGFFAVCINGCHVSYAKSKLEGENNVLQNFPLATILRPSIVYSVDDNFTTNFMTLLNRLPIFPLYYEGKTKFAPIHCSDLTDTINHIISKSGCC